MDNTTPSSSSLSFSEFNKLVPPLSNRRLKINERLKQEIEQLKQELKEKDKKIQALEQERLVLYSTLKSRMN